MNQVRKKIKRKNKKNEIKTRTKNNKTKNKTNRWSNRKLRKQGTVDEKKRKPCVSDANSWQKLRIL